jgi:hypothetical protein
VNARADRAGRPDEAQAVNFGLGLGVPLAVVALAYGLWWLSDRLVYIGPFDRAAFGWAVVIPVWVSAPIAAGFAWRRLSARRTLVAAITVGAAVGAATAALLWQSVAYPACEDGAARAPADWILPSLFVGVIVGAGLAASGLLAVALLRRKQPWRAAILGAGAELALVLLAVVVAAGVMMGPSCQRPPI